MTTLTLAELDAARRDPVVFADVMLGQPLWPHQVEVVRSPARYRVLCAGRRAGKTRVFGVLALWTMFRQPGAKVLIVSAGETSVKRTHAEISAMVNSAIGTASSVEDDGVHALRLSNGSTLESVPSSLKAVRSAEADLLIVDEAGFVEQEVWESAEPVVGARQGARVLISSTPWRGPGHFFHDLWRQGMDRPDAEVQSWHWPSTVSPMVDRVWLDGVRQRSASDYFLREFEATWQGQFGAYFDEDELMDNVADYALMDAAAIREHSAFANGVGTVRDRPAVAGVDWGMRRDSNALVLVSPLEDFGANDERIGGDGRRAMFVPYLVAESGWQWDDFAAHVADISAAYALHVVASELNGVGDAATRMLELAIRAKRGPGPVTYVSGVWTDMRRKQAGFGKIKLLLQRGLLVLPRHPELLKQLRALEFEQSAAGGVRISVPENKGHDDLAMALLQAVSCLSDPEGWRWRSGVSVLDSAIQRDQAWQAYRVARDQHRAQVGDGGRCTEAGLLVPARPLPERGIANGWFWMPQGQERGEAW